jgi:hypothetical protein
MGQRDFSVSVVIKMTALKMVDGWCEGFPSVMDQTNTEPTIEKPAPKKTLREVYANAASGLLLMMNESVTEEMTDIEHPKCNIEEAASSCSPNNI